MDESMKENSLINRRYSFYSRCQQSTESFDDFLKDIIILAKCCEFNGLEATLIRDRVIFGAVDPKLKDVFLKDGDDPSLEEVMEMSRLIASTNADDISKESITNKLTIAPGDNSFCISEAWSSF